MLAAKLRRAMVNPAREPLSGLVAADETIIPFRTKNDPVVLPAGRTAARLRYTLQYWFGVGPNRR
jgi:hypothetical protein